MSKLALPTVPSSGLFKQGYQNYQSEDGIVNRNIAAVREISSIVRTSVGPSGRNKIIVNNIQKVFLTSDASTILGELEIVHPAVKVVVMASQQQDLEMGDASNFVVVLAGELLSQAEELVRIGMSPTEIVAGFEQGKAHAQKLLSTIESDPQVGYQQILQSVMAPKQYGHERVLAKLVAEAVEYVLPKGSTSFNVDNIRIVKIMGASLNASRVIKGMVFPFKPEGSVQELSGGGKVAIFTAPVDVSQTETKGTVLLHNAKEMLEFSKGEEQQMDELFAGFKELGIKCVIAGSGVGSLAIHYLNKHGILVIKVGSKFDLQRLSRVTGAKLMPSLKLPSEKELGVVDNVTVEEFGGDRVTIFQQVESSTRTATIVLRGATQNLLEDVERAIDDGVAAVKSLTKSVELVPGAGAAEMAIAREVHAQGERTAGTLQHAVKAYGRAFEVIPRTLADNAGLDATEVISNIYANPNNDSIGVDIEHESDSGVVDARERGIWDIALAKRSAIDLATEAAATVLTVDQIIMAKRAGGPALPKQGGDWDQD